MECFMGIPHMLALVSVRTSLYLTYIYHGKTLNTEYSFHDSLHTLYLVTPQQKRQLRAVFRVRGTPNRFGRTHT